MPGLEEALQSGIANDEMRQLIEATIGNQEPLHLIVEGRELMITIHQIAEDNTFAIGSLADEQKVIINMSTPNPLARILLVRK